jgi:peroxiredoxin
MRRKDEARGLQVIGVSISEEPEVEKEAAARKKFDWPQICDGQGTAGPVVRLYTASSPAHFVIGRDGRIAAAHRGMGGLPAIERVIAGLLGE